MRKFTTFLLSMILAVLALPIQAAVSPNVVIDKEYTDLASLDGGVPFAIVNKETGKALYGSTAQNLAYDVLSAAYSASNTGYYFKLDAPAEDTADETIAACYLLRLLTPAGDEYNIWGSPGYINSQPADGACSFILGLVKGNGQDMKNGAVWDIQYVDGKGFTLLNKATGKYLNDAAPAKYDEPVYWTFCTLKVDYSTAFTPLFEEEAKIKANGTSDEANAVYDAAVADIKAALEAGTLENAEQAVTTVDEALNVLAKAQTAAGSDFTRAIVNPTVDGADGWICERPNGGNGPLLSGSSFEYWAGNANPRSEAQFNYYQDITGLANGIYTLSAEMYNSLNGEEGATFEPTCGLYAQSGSTTKVQLVQEDGMTLTEYSVSGIEVTDGTLRIGVKSTESLAARWFVADNFHLTLEKAITDDPKPNPDPEVSLIKNASFEEDGEKAASNGPLTLTGWTFEGVGTSYNNTEIRPANSASATSAYGTSDPSEGSYSLFFRQGWNGSGNVITLTSDEIAELPAGSYKLSVDYKSYYGYDNTPTQNTTVGIALKNGETVLASEVSAPAEGGTNSTYFNETPWSTLVATFSLENTLDAGSQVVITLNAGGQKRSDFFVDNVQLVKISEAEIALENLNKIITSAQAIVDAKANVGDGLFQIPTKAYDTLSEEVAVAKAVIGQENVTAEDLKAAQEALESALAAYKATPATAPAADKQYVLSLKTSDENSPFQLSIASGKVSIEEAGTPITFVAKENGTYALSNGEEYVVYEGSNNWDMSTSTEDGYGWTIAAVEGGYTLTGKNARFFGTNTSNGNGAGSSCFGDKKADNGNYIWTIAEYAASEPVLATIANDATVTLPEGELEVDEDGFVKATLTGKITVDESIADDAQAFLVYSLTEKTEDAGDEDEPVQIIKGGVDISRDDEEEEYAELEFDVESQEINLAVEPGKKYTLTVKSIVVNYYDDTVKDMVVAGEKIFDGDEAVVIDFATASEPVLATIADDATVTVPEGELEVDENGYVHATFTGLITVDESIADKGGAVLYYNLDEVADETGGIIKSGADLSEDDEEETGDDEDAKLIKLELGVESQEILIPAEAGKKYVLTVNAVMAGNYYYDEDEQEELLNVEAAKEFVDDDALVITFTTKAAPAPVLATLDFVDLATGDDAAIDEEDGTYPVVFSYGLTLDESIAAMASGSVTYTVYKGEDAIGTYETDFDVAKEERTIYVAGLEYSTAYTVKIDKVVISYFDMETFESLVAGEFTEPTSSVSFTTNAKTEPVPTFDIDKEFTSLESLKGAVFAIVNKETGKALYGSDNQNLGYDVAEVAFAETNAGFYFKVDTLSKGTEEETYALRMLTPAGEEYNIWGEPGYLNSQPAETGWCSFILGLNNQNGRDLKDGAAWDIQYVEGKGFTLLNKGTGKYLTSNDAAKSDEPVYWTFCTINGTKIATGIDGINAAKAADGKYIENGKVVIVKNGKKISVAGFGIK